MFDILSTGNNQLFIQTLELNYTKIDLKTITKIVVFLENKIKGNEKKSSKGGSA